MPLSAPNLHVTERRWRVRQLGRMEYLETWEAMRGFTMTRGPATADELWLVEHPPVYTVGLSCRDETRATIGGVPLVHSDRGGQITYHGPGQVVAYVLMDLRRRGWGVRTLVNALEQAVIELLAGYGVAAVRRAGAPGVYVDGRKIASLGLRVRQGCSYHGLSLNVAMDLAPFGRIHPCGYRGLQVTQLADLGIADSPARSGERLANQLGGCLGYTGADFPAPEPPRPHPGDIP